MPDTNPPVPPSPSSSSDNPTLVLLERIASALDALVDLQRQRLEVEQARLELEVAAPADEEEAEAEAEVPSSNGEPNFDSLDRL